MKVTALARIPVIAALLTPYCLGMSQGVGQILEGGTIPTKVNIKDLPEKFHPVRITTNSSMFSDMTMLMGLSASRGTSLNPALIGLSWTDGSTTTIEGGKYLVTYQLDLGGFAGMGETVSSPPLSPALKLVLVKTDSISTLASEPSITRNDLVNMMMAPAQAGMAVAATPDEPGFAAPAEAPMPVGGYQGGPIPATEKTRGLNNIKQLALGTMIYSADYDDVYPWPQSTRGLQEVTAPYLKNMDLWKSQNPNGGKILFNMALGGVSQTTIPDPAGTVLLYDSNAWPGGQRLVAFVDGHARFVNEQVWKDLKKTLTAKYPKTAKRPLPSSLGLDKR